MPSYSSLAQQEALAKQLAITQQAHDQLIASSTIMHDDEDVIPLEERIAQRQREQAAWEHAIGVQQQETQQAMLGQLQTLMQSLDGGATVDDDTEMEQGTIYKAIPTEVPQFTYHDSGDEIPPMSNSPSLGSVAPPSEPQLMTQCPSCGVPNYQFAYDQLFHAHVGSCYINKHVKTPMYKPMPVPPQQPKQMLHQIRDAVAKLDEQQRTSLMDAFKKLSGAGQNSNQQSIAHVLSMLYTPATKPQSPMNSPSHFSLDKSAAQQPTRTHAMPPPPPPQYLDPQFYAMQQHHHHQLDNSHQSAPTEEESYEYDYEQEQSSEAPQQAAAAAAPVDPAAGGERPFWEDDVIPPEEREYQRQLHESYLAQQAAYYREQQEIYELNQRQNAEVYGEDYEQHYPAPHQYAEYYGHHHHHHHHQQHHHQPQHQHHPAYQYHQYAPDYSQDYSPDSMDSPEYSGSW